MRLLIVLLYAALNESNVAYWMILVSVHFLITSRMTRRVFFKRGRDD